VLADACPSPSGTAEPRLEVADVFRRFGPTYLRAHLLTPQQGKVLRHVIDCRTAALGGHLHVCPTCGWSKPMYNPCRDRHCPTCQGQRGAAWVAERLERLVPTHHFHVVFTLPAQLRPLALVNPRLVYDLLFAAASDTLLELADSRWDALPAVTAVLHTWTRQLSFHPHLYCIVSGGGLSRDRQRWVACRPSYLFPVRVLGKLFRGKFLDGLVRAHRAGKLRFTGDCDDLADDDAFARLRDTLYRTSWLVYSKKTFGGPEQVLSYLGSYTHRVGIASSRLLRVDADAILFHTHRPRTCTLSPDEFIRRFLLHVLPHGFRKIRHYGLVAPSSVPALLPLAQRLAAALDRRRRRAQPPLVVVIPNPDALLEGRCPNCKSGLLLRQLLPPARGPPGVP
jgi:hypothetical protein